MKTTLKIYKDVYKRLQEFRIKHDCKTVSDAVKLLLDKVDGS